MSYEIMMLGFFRPGVNFYRIGYCSLLGTRLLTETISSPRLRMFHRSCILTVNFHGCFLMLHIIFQWNYLSHHFSSFSYHPPLQFKLMKRSTSSASDSSIQQQGLLCSGCSMGSDHYKVLFGSVVMVYS